MLGNAGVVSVTFRSRTVEQILALCKRNGLAAVEWGGDVHVPPGDLANARRVGELTRAAGLACASYGSYLRLGAAEPDAAEQTVAAAVALGAANLRVWAGGRASADTGPEAFDEIVRQARRLAERCAAAGLTLSFEYHGLTLTDGRESAVRLMRAVDHPSCRIYWQPVQLLSREENLSALRAVLPWLSNVHVFHWLSAPDNGAIRRPLAEGAADWASYLSALRADARTHHLLLEFVREETAAVFGEDCRTLRGWTETAV